MLLTDFLIVALFLVGVGLFRSPKGALYGNGVAALALLLAGLSVALQKNLFDLGWLALALVLGSTTGWWRAVRSNMAQIPALIAFQHGAGGMAAFIVSLVELIYRPDSAGTAAKASGLFGMVLGAATFSASMLASGRLSGWLGQKPVVWRRHHLLVVLTSLAAVGMAVAGASQTGGPRVAALAVALVLAALLGLVFAVRVGGADMPVLISFLNATSGLAAAASGLIVDNRLLVAAGAAVAASGLVLTMAMCQAMNRGLNQVLWGRDAGSAGSPTDQLPAAPTPVKEAEKDHWGSAVAACREARSVIIVPGYGIALADAHHEVARLARWFEEAGKDVQFAIHPVAGRMPGHMHVLLAEADVPYTKLCDMDQINGDFAGTDLAIIVGASDVVNPAATSLPGTPISGMPILEAHRARTVLVFNLDSRPGYSGVQNLLYEKPNALLLWGDAKENLARLVDRLGACAAATA
ncbi:MAG: NAD(P)(+) transhydrogenase (Re/Si-specific) subunit beta [Acidobacteriota bacterium]